MLNLELCCWVLHWCGARSCMPCRGQDMDMLAGEGGCYPMPGSECEMESVVRATGA